MALKFFKPTTPSMRNTVLIDRSELSKVAPKKSLLVPLNKFAGRNNSGQITMRHQGGGVKKKYRLIDFKRDKKNIQATVETLEYDPNRNSFISLLKYSDGDWRYIITPDGLKVGDKVVSSDTGPIQVGNTLPLKNIPQGMMVHNLEIYPGSGAIMGRSAGTSVQVMGGTKGYIQVKLPSGELRLIKDTCLATLGSVSNPDQKNVKIGKAGRNRRKGIRPSVRGVAMSMTHPHGGGQGKKGRHGSGGPAQDLWGNRLGTRTRKNRKPSSRFIVKRRFSKNNFKKYKTII